MGRRTVPTLHRRHRSLKDRPRGWCAREDNPLPKMASVTPNRQLDRRTFPGMGSFCRIIWFRRLWEPLPVLECPSICQVTFMPSPSSCQFPREVSGHQPSSLHRSAAPAIIFRTHEAFQDAGCPQLPLVSIPGYSDDKSHPIQIFQEGFRIVPRVVQTGQSWEGGPN